jgi:hypothetical protein
LTSIAFPALCVGFSSNQLHRATEVAARFERVIGAVTVNDESQRLETRWGLVNAVQCEPAAFSTVARAIIINPRQGRSKLARISEH